MRALWEVLASCSGHVCCEVMWGRRTFSCFKKECCVILELEEEPSLSHCVATAVMMETMGGHTVGSRCKLSSDFTWGRYFIITITWWPREHDFKTAFTFGLLNKQICLDNYFFNCHRGGGGRDELTVFWMCNGVLHKRTLSIYLGTVFSCQWTRPTIVVRVHSRINVIISITVFVHTDPVENLDEP